MTGEQAFDAAVALMGEYRPEEESYDVAGFRYSAVQVINILAAELDELDCNLKKIDPDSDEHVFPKIERLSDTVPLHDMICSALLPMGMCCMFLCEENPVRSNFFYRMYEKELEEMKRRFLRVKRHRVKNVYGGI